MIVNRDSLPFINQINQGPEKLTLENGMIKVTTNNPTISQGLLYPYRDQMNNISRALQSEKVKELWGKLKTLHEHATVCIKARDNAIIEANKKCLEMETRMNNAIADANYWKTLNDQKTGVCKDLAGRLLTMKRKEATGKMIAENRYEEDAESSTGENDVDVARTRGGKRRRV